MPPTPLPPPATPLPIDGSYLDPQTPAIPDLSAPLSVQNDSHPRTPAYGPPPTPVGLLPPGTPLHVPPPSPVFAPKTPYTPHTPANHLHHVDEMPQLRPDQLHSILDQEPHPLMENMGYDQNDPMMANMGYDEHHPPAHTPGAISEKGQATPWNEDYEFPNSAGPPDEQQTDETYEQFEERVLNKRAAHMYHILKSRLARQSTLHFSEMAYRNNKKQVAQKFYTLLVLKKTQVLELEQEAAFEEIVISKGQKFDNPSL